MEVSEMKNLCKRLTVLELKCLKYLIGKRLEELEKKGGYEKTEAEK